MKSVILVTGAGTGIGKLSALALAEAGHVVYASMRDVEGRNRGRADELRAISAQRGNALMPLELDVLSQDSADAAAATIVREQGRIDVVMQNAGHLVVGPSEAFTPEEMMKVFDTNLFGAQRVNRAVLPYMRKQESGLVLWISSTTTKGGFPPLMGPSERPRRRWIRLPSHWLMTMKPGGQLKHGLAVEAGLDAVDADTGGDRSTRMRRVSQSPPVSHHQAQ
jgi:NAD(P)-dependent dehydrogenase (short-subunit alcohol dehydrogenase family)